MALTFYREFQELSTEHKKHGKMREMQKVIDDRIFYFFLSTVNLKKIILISFLFKIYEEYINDQK